MGKPVVYVYVCVCLLFVGMFEGRTVCLNNAPHHISAVCHICCIPRNILWKRCHLLAFSFFIYLTNVFGILILHAHGERDYNCNRINNIKSREFLVWKSASRGLYGNFHTSFAVKCSAFWSIEADSREIGTSTCSEDWHPNLTLFTADVFSCVGNKLPRKKTRRTTGKQQLTVLHNLSERHSSNLNLYFHKVGGIARHQYVILPKQLKRVNVSKLTRYYWTLPATLVFTC